MSLQAEIVNRIFSILGSEKTNFVIESLFSDKFLIDKKISFEFEEQGKDCKIFGGKLKSGSTELKIILSDISIEEREYAAIIQNDNNFPIGIRLSDEDCENFFIFAEENWIPASKLHQAQMLVGFESISEACATFEKLEDYYDLYKVLIKFINKFEEINE